MKKLLLSTSLLLLFSFLGHSYTIYWSGGTFYEVSFPFPVVRSAPDLTDETNDFTVGDVSCIITSNCIVKSLNVSSGDLTISNSSTLTIAENVIVNSSATITVENGSTLIISSSVSNSGTIIINTGGNLIQTGTGSATGSGYQISATGSGSVNNYNFWSSPVSGANLPSTFSGANGCDFYYYNAGGAEFRRLSAYSTCTPLATSDGSSIMSAGVGYSVAGGGNPTFSGTVNTNTINNTTISSGWNLVGNPYPSSILGSAFIAANGHTTGTLYFWSDDASSGGGYSEGLDYATWNAGGGVAATGGGAATIPNGSIGVAQGFFVSTSTGANISFTNSMRSGSNNSQFFKTTTEIQKIWISAITPKNSSQILFTFTENATEEEDWSYDSKRFSSGNDFTFGSILGENPDPYAIQSFSDLDLETSREVPLSIYSASSGATSFQLDGTENLDTNIIIFIKDNATGKTQELANGPFTTYLNANQLYDGRFTILFKNKNGPVPTSISEVHASYLNLTYAENSLFVNNVVPMEQLDVISITGSVIFSISLQSTYEKSVLVNHLSKGVYIARVQNIDGSIASKKFVVQ
ncbi:MAG: hypothetical protein ACI85Q_000074 [Salibacteraceae bacterium]|jgi:hypothetical protein